MINLFENIAAGRDTLAAMKPKLPKKAIRGFAAMPIPTRRRVQSLGGLAVAKRKGWMKHLGSLGGTAKGKNARKAKMARKDSND